MDHRFAVLVSAMLFTSAPAFAEHESPLAKLLPPDDQEQERLAKPMTIGIPFVNPYNLPGQVQFRPTGRLLVGVGYDATIFGTTGDLGDGYQLHADQHAASLYVQYYPIKASGFYVGLGTEERFGSFTVRKTDADGNDQLTAKGDYAAVYGGPSFGMTWLWDSGFTLGFDVSKRKRFTESVTVDPIVPGTPAALGGDVGAQVTPDAILGTLMLGYSF